MKEKPSISVAQFRLVGGGANRKRLEDSRISLRPMPFMSELFSNCFVRKINRRF